MMTQSQTRLSKHSFTTKTLSVPSEYEFVFYISPKCICLPADLVQDIASKGLGVVYELGSEEQKKELVNALVGSLMEGSATKPDQSNLFHGDKGVGKAPDG